MNPFNGQVFAHAFRLSGETHEKEFSWGFLNASIIPKEGG